MFLEQENAHRHELFGYRSDIENRFRGQGGVALQISHSVSLLVDDGFRKLAKTYGGYDVRFSGKIVYPGDKRMEAIK